MRCTCELFDFRTAYMTGQGERARVGGALRAEVMRVAACADLVGDGDRCGKDAMRQISYILQLTSCMPASANLHECKNRRVHFSSRFSSLRGIGP